MHGYTVEGRGDTAEEGVPFDGGGEVELSTGTAWWQPNRINWSSIIFTEAFVAIEDVRAFSGHNPDLSSSETVALFAALEAEDDLDPSTVYALVGAQSIVSLEVA